MRLKKLMENLKDKHGKDLSRPFAPNKRPTKEDLHKVRVVPKGTEYEVTEDEGRIRVTKKECD